MPLGQLFGPLADHAKWPAGMVWSWKGSRSATSGPNAELPAQWVGPGTRADGVLCDLPPILLPYFAETFTSAGILVGSAAPQRHVGVPTGWP